MANIDNTCGFKPVAVLAGDAIPMWHGLVASNSAISVSGHGADVIFATAGYITPTATTDLFPAGVAVTKITSTTTQVSMLFYPAVDWIVFEGQTSGAMSQGNIWTVVDYEGTTGIQEINEDASDNDQIIIIGKDPNSSLGTWCRAQFIFAKSKFTGKATEGALSSYGYGV